MSFSSVVVIPTNAITIYISDITTNSNYGRLVALGTYAALAALTYTQLQRV